MSCAAIKIKGENGEPDIRAIVCGLPRPKRCAFCGDRSEVLCDWRVEKEKLVDVVSLKVGDVIMHPRRTITGIKLVMGGSIRITCEPNDDHVQVPIGGRFVKAMPGACDKPACFRHHRSVGEDVDYCQDHWKEMEKPL